MNPSAPGWISKHIPYFLQHTLPQLGDEMSGYKRFRENGFIYGTSVQTLNDEESNHLKWTEQERTKINLLDALVLTYYENIDNASEEDCVQSILSFYRLINDKTLGIFETILGQGKPDEQLEHILSQRIQTNEPLLQKNFSHLITNALLYLDVLAYDHYLITTQSPYSYAAQLEKLLSNVLWIALQKKEDKNEYNHLLLKLFEHSLRYAESTPSTVYELHELTALSTLTQPLEQQYFLDLTCLALWEDHYLDTEEDHFIHNFAAHLDLPKTSVQDALSEVNTFITKHKESIPYLNYSNPVKHFYNQTSRTVSTLILRNRKRLIIELRESKDLVKLLGASTYRDLDPEERTHVKKQLLDICKAVPSLAIFILPGGGLLLPLLMKFIPQLLPSAFNENKEE